MGRANQTEQAIRDQNIVAILECLSKHAPAGIEAHGIADLTGIPRPRVRAALVALKHREQVGNSEKHNGVSLWYLTDD